MRLIDADKLIEKLSTGLDNPEEFPVINLGTLMRMIDTEPTVKTEIIHCGECKLNLECCRVIRSTGRKDDDYCSCGVEGELLSLIHI